MDVPLLKRLGFEGVAGADLALRDAALEPVHALRRGAVGEGVRHHFAARLALQGVVADGRGGVERAFDVALLDDVTRLIGVVSPDAGKTVGLQFQAHRQGVGLLFGHGAARLVDFPGNAEEVLHVMADFMGDHVGLRKIAGDVEALLHQFVEAQVDVDLLVAGAVERTGGGLAGAAGGRRAAGEQHQLRPHIGRAAGLEDLAPGVFGIGQHGRDETRHLVVRRRLVRRRRMLHGCDLPAAAEHVDDRERIDAEEVGCHQRHRDAAQTDRATAAEGETAASAAAIVATAVFNVVAFAIAFPFHDCFLDVALNCC